MIIHSDAAIFHTITWNGKALGTMLVERICKKLSVKYSLRYFPVWYRKSLIFPVLWQEYESELVPKFFKQQHLVSYSNFILLNEILLQTTWSLEYKKNSYHIYFFSCADIWCHCRQENLPCLKDSICSKCKWWPFFSYQKKIKGNVIHCFLVSLLKSWVVIPSYLYIEGEYVENLTSGFRFYCSYFIS